MNRQRLTALVCVLVLLATLMVIPAVQADQTDTVYVRKHVSLLYDNSRSMQMNYNNLKWCYASYAAQVFTGLLNDTDTLTITFMNDLSTSQMALDLSADRQAQVDRVLRATSEAWGGTPLSSVYTALDVLLDEGLLSDAQLGTAEVDESEQYWLVLTTDGVFNDDYGYGYDPEDVEEALAQILEEYSSLQLVYFGIGTAGDTSPESAIDFSSSTMLNAYPNFSAYFAQDQNQIVSIMQQMSNRLSGRYDVRDDISVSGNTVTFRISGETSPIRNVALLAQQTNARLVSATAEDGTVLEVSRSASVSYPTNPEYYNMPSGTLGGHIAMITSTSGKIPAGTVTLTFSEAVTADSLSLMYEPAIYVSLGIQRKNSQGQWENVPATRKFTAGDTLRIQYEICEDGSDTPLDASRLPGESVAEFTCGDRVIQAGQEFQVPAGNTTITASVSLMDGAYRISTSRTIRAVEPSDFKVTVSDPLTIVDTELTVNTQEHIDFTVLLDDSPADNDLLGDFRLDTGGLRGQTTQPGGGVIRFTPRHTGCTPGNYTITLYHGDAVMASQTVSVITITYSAAASADLTLVNDRLGSNTEAITFRVTIHRGNESSPITQADSDRFRVEAEARDGTVLNGTVAFQNGIFTFTPNDPDTPAGDYAVTLYQGNVSLAQANVTVIPVTYSAAASGDLTLVNDRLGSNTEAITFQVTAHRGDESSPITPAEAEAFRVEAVSQDGTVLNGSVAFQNSSFTFTPNDPNTPVGDYTVTVYQGDTALAQAKVTVLPVTYSAGVSEDLEIIDAVLAENTQSITFRVSAQRNGVTQPITEEESAQFTVSAAAEDGTVLDGVIAFRDGTFTFTPGGEAPVGEYEVTLYFGGATLAQAKVTVIPDPVTYTAESDRELTLFSNAVAGNTESIVFTVTAHRDSADTPITAEEVEKFRLEAVSADGTVLNGTVVFMEPGQLVFTPNDGQAPVGSYTVTLYQGDTELARSTVTILLYNAQYTVEAHVPTDATVQRFGLLNNQTAVSFVVYADGVPCSQEQLRSMVQEMLRITQTPESGLMDLDITIGTWNGLPAVTVRPTSSTDNSFLEFWQRPFAAMGLVPTGDLDITLTVDAAKGDSATGKLQIVDTLAERIFYLALLFGILILAVLIGMLVYSNLRMPRITPGYLLYYQLILVDGQYYVSNRDELAIRHRLYFRLLPIPETVDFRGQTFSAGAPGFGFRLLNLTLPKCTVREAKRELCKYYDSAATVNADELLETLRIAAVGAIPPHQIEHLFPSISAIPIPYGAAAEETDSHTFLMSDGGYILKKDQTLEFWAFTTEE